MKTFRAFGPTIGKSKLSKKIIMFLGSSQFWSLPFLGVGSSAPFKSQYRNVLMGSSIHGRLLWPKPSPLQAEVSVAFCADEMYEINPRFTQKLPAAPLAKYPAAPET